MRSWGNYPKFDNIKSKPIFWQDQPNLFTDLPVLPYGQGRSYGDSCLNPGGVALETAQLNRFIHFDPESGILRCEAGLTLAEILKLSVPQGWSLPVMPGTQFVSVGGAIANDVHGKNHHRAGTFGSHVRAFELLRSDGSRRICSLQESPDFFAATIGGLGLTGLITWVELQLHRIPSPFLAVDTIPFYSVEEFLALSTEAEAVFDYTVAWIDCQASGSRLGRGLFMQANYLSAEAAKNLKVPASKKRSVPFLLPAACLNHWSMSAFNRLYFAKGCRQGRAQPMHYQAFFFPLDAILHWNRIYGKPGFLQYQCVIPPGNEASVLKDLLAMISASGQGSFLSVLKKFSEMPSPGLLSFPTAGVTLALDFPFRGQKTLDLLSRLDTIVQKAGGRLYPAKDARMSAEMFLQGYPNLPEFWNYVDPGFSSNFWRRMNHG